MSDRANDWRIERINREAMRARLKSATLVEYEHGGGRLYYESPDGSRELIADFYGDGYYRDVIMEMIRSATR